MRAAVVGVGHLGQHHARILASLPGVSLAGVVDLNRERAAKIADDGIRLAVWPVDPFGFVAAVNKYGAATCTISSLHIVQDVTDHP